MSFYGTSFYELKEYFKRFLFQNGNDEPITFEPNDIFDGLKQKSDHWIRFDKGQEDLPDGSTADILLISHNIPNKEEVDIGGLHFYSQIEDVYGTDLDNEDKIIQYALQFLNPGTIATLPDFDIDKKGHMVFKGNKVFAFPDNIIGFIDPNTNEIIKVSPKDAVDGDGSYILFSGNDYIEFTFDELTGALQINHKIGENNDGIDRKFATPKYYNNIQEAIDALVQEGIKDSNGNEYTADSFKEKIQSYRSGNILQIPNFKYDKYGHMVQDETEPYNYLRLDMADSYQIVNFTVTFDEGWELVGDEEGTENDNTDLMELSIYQKRVPELMPYISSIETVFNVACDNNTRLKLIQAGITEFWIDNIQGEPIIFIRGESSAFNTGKELDKFAFQTQVVSSYESAAAAEGINGAVIVTLGYTDYENYEKPGLCNHTYEEIVSYLEMGKMVLCYDVTTKQYYVPYGEGFNHKVWGNYIGFSSITNKDDNDEFGGGKDDGATPSKSWITSTKIIIPSASKLSEEGILADVRGTQQFYIKIVDYNLGAKINDFIANGQEAIESLSTTLDERIAKVIKDITITSDDMNKALQDLREEFAPYLVLDSQTNSSTLSNIKQASNNGNNVYYNSPKGLLLLSSLHENYATFTYNAISDAGIEFTIYTLNSNGNITSNTYTLNKNQILPTGGSNGQVLVMTNNGPQWTTLNIPKIVSDTTDIGANANMEDNTLYLVYEN